MKIFDEETMLDEEFRSQIIHEIEDTENQKRKAESYKRWEILKDRVKKYVLEELQIELDIETVEEMKSRASSINIYKKIVSKKARVYQTAPTRKLTEGDEEQFIKLGDLINLNTKMKKSNKYLEAFLNCLIYIRPYKDYSQKRADGQHLWKYELRILPPHMYDVIEDSENPEILRAVIISDYEETLVYSETYPYNRKTNSGTRGFRDGNNKNEAIADSPADSSKPEKKYIWWSTKYHMTTGEKGQIIADCSPENLENPIEELPFVDLARDRDGSFWSVGGEDVIEGSVLTNMLITDYNFIAKIQSMGIFYLFGKGIPKQYKIGPNRAITLEVNTGDPPPNIGFANANPKLSELSNGIKQYVAMLLTTNDLGVNSVSASLDGKTLESGVQELIQHSEPMNAIEDDQEIFRDAEPLVMDKVTKWHNYYFEKNLLSPEFAEIGAISDFNYTIRYSKPEQYMTEEKKRASQKMRKELGIADEVAFLMEDDPDLSAEDAEKQLLEMQARKMKKLAQGMIDGNYTEGSDQDNPIGLEQDSDSE